MGERIYTEQSPDVQAMADQLQKHWNKLRGALLDQPNYRVGSRHRKSFEKAALTVVRQNLKPDLFVQAQLRTPADASRCQPNWLSGSKAVERYKHFCESQLQTDVGIYVSQFNLINRLRDVGRDWDHIEQGAYNISPMMLWIMFTLNGMPERAQPYKTAAKAEFAKCPNVVDLFGPKVLELR